MNEQSIDIDSPGFNPKWIFEELTDSDIARLLPNGVYRLLRAVVPDELKGPHRNDVLKRSLSLELVMDDLLKRSILLKALPKVKRQELEIRTRASFGDLLEMTELPSRVRNEVLGFFGLSKPNPSVAESLDFQVDVHPQRALFPHQKKVAREVEEFLYRDQGRVMLHLPTGVGKTRTAMCIVANHLRMNECALVLWLANTRELLEQAFDEFQATWSATGDRKVRCVRYWSSYDSDILKVADGIIFAGLGKLNNFAKDRQSIWALGDQVSMVVFDEAHQALAETYRDIIESVVTRKPRTPLLGLTATPGRTWNDPQMDMLLSDVFFNNKVTMTFEGSNPIAFLTAEGYLAKAEFNTLNVDAGIELTEGDKRELARALDIPKGLLRTLGENEQRNLRIMQRLLKMSEDHSRILVFAASVANALILVSLCKGVGLDGYSITSQTDKATRGKAIRDFKSPDPRTKVLINYGVLTTGFDAPKASAALIARPTKSLVLYSQMVGRVLRGPKAGGTEYCEVVSVVDKSLPGFGDIAESFLNWEDVWS